MKKPKPVTLITFQATSNELLALSGLLLLYLGHVSRQPNPTPEDQLMSQTLTGFYDRLVSQLPKTGGPRD